MDLRFIEKNTNLTIYADTNNDVYKRAFKVKFYELFDQMSFLIESEELFKSFKELKVDMPIDISFFRTANMYAFKGKVHRVLQKNGLYLTHIRQMSSIEISTRRISPRHEIIVPVKLYESFDFDINDSDTPNDNADILLSDKTFDISNEGLCIASNIKIKLNMEQIYVLEFVLNKMDRFVLPGKLVRSGNCPQSVQFKYDYGFLLDFTNNPDEKSRLVTSIFKHKIGR